MGKKPQLLLQYRGDGFRLGHELRPAGSVGPSEACHEHELEVCFVERGSELGLLDGIDDRIVAGECTLIAPGAVHSSWTEAESVRELILHFATSRLEQLAEQLRLPGPVPLASVRRRTPPDTQRLVDALKHELCGPANPLVVENLATTIGAAVLRWGDTPTQPTGLERAEILLRADPSASHTLEELAEEAGLSRFHFARSFKLRFGEPPHQYRLRLRVERARELMRDPARSLTEIAYELGFSSQSRLTEAFKDRYGQTPSAWRSAISGK